MGVVLCAQLGLAGEFPVCTGLPDPATKTAIQAVCRELRRELASVPGTAVGVVRETFLDERSGCVRRGCVVKVTGSIRAVEGRPSPEDTPERYLAAQGWTSLLPYAADGPDGTAYAMHWPGAICLVRSDWSHWHDDAGSHLEDGYKVTISCGHATETPPG